MIECSIAKAEKLLAQNKMTEMPKDYLPEKRNFFFSFFLLFFIWSLARAFEQITDFCCIPHPGIPEEEGSWFSHMAALVSHREAR